MTANDIAEADRLEAYESVIPDLARRKREIVACLQRCGAMSVTDIVDDFVGRGVLPCFDRNYVAPRLTELKRDGLVVIVGRKPSRTGRYEAIWRLTEV